MSRMNKTGRPHEKGLTLTPRGRLVTAAATFLAAMLATSYLFGAFASTSVLRIAAGPSAAFGMASEPTRPCERPALIGTPIHAVTARTAPRSSGPAIEVFGRQTVLGTPQVFLLRGEAFDAEGESWFKALLPIRPNGSTGYIPASALRVQSTVFHLRLERDRFRLEFYRRCTLVAVFRVGIGNGATPTPLGRFYLASLFQLPRPNTIYGTYAYGLSGYSNVLKNWEFGGIVGLHGTNDPSSIGEAESHGCVRMRNSDIEQLVKILPLGTPITIVAGGTGGDRR
jgi:hypothetical protein